MKTLLTSLILLTPFTVSARIGETPAQCQSRYGKPVKVDKTDNTIIFKKSGFFIIAYYWKGTAHKLTFRKVEANSIGTPEKISDAEKEALLKANAQGSSWVDANQISMDKFWKRKDEKALAAYKTIDRMLIVVTEAFAKHQASEQAKSEKEKIKGF